MEKQAKLMWHALAKVCGREPLPKMKELPIQAVSALIRTLLRELRAIDAPDLVLTETMIEDVIYRVAFLQIQDHLLQTQPNATRRRGKVA